MRYKSLRREETPGHARFLTFSCFQRQPLMLQDGLAARFVQALALARFKLRFKLYGWVVMPEHIHLLLTPDLPSAPVPLILNAIKAPLARSALAERRRAKAPVLDQITDARGDARFWLPGGGYDRNIYSASEFTEKLEYIHNNPVKRGLAKRPPDYPWSSAGWYAGERDGALVELDPIHLCEAEPQGTRPSRCASQPWHPEEAGEALRVLTVPRRRLSHTITPTVR